MGTLYECLREVRLEKYYNSLRAHGITKSESLTHLTVQDCPALGIFSPDDKRRFLDLIAIIRSVHESEDSYRPLSESRCRIRDTVSSRKRNRSRINRGPVSITETRTGPSLSLVHEVQVRDGEQRKQITNIDADVYALAAQGLSDSSTEESNDSSEHSDYEPVSKQSNNAIASPSRGSKISVERVRHSEGYNYGLPRSKVRSKLPSTKNSKDEKIRVCIRKRPLNRREAKTGDDDIVQVETTNMLIVNEPKLAVDLKPYTLQHEFLFDEVFGENCSNEDVYTRAARPLIPFVFNRGSATCFAYGQTGAGKTHTMIGSRDVPGIYYMAAQDIFSLMESGEYGTNLKLWVSYFEIYCGQLFDLLNKRNRLQAREDANHKVCIAGLTETIAGDADSLMQILEYGNAVRSKGSTGVNPDSSRSHAILQMEVRREGKNEKLGKFSFIDLAGSERASDMTDTTGKQGRMEGAEINQSLLALKECIRSIDQDSRHTPFRQSKLTHILKDSFVGNSRTCMIANVSPTQSACDNTLNTLRYADRVKELRREMSASSVKSNQLLMNIPCVVPSFFHPSNIQFSSTPMKVQVRHTKSSTQGSPDEDVTLFDPSETPIRGHKISRKTGAKIHTQKPLRSSTIPQSKMKVIRHKTPDPEQPVLATRYAQAEPLPTVGHNSMQASATLESSRYVLVKQSSSSHCGNTSKSPILVAKNAPASANLVKEIGVSRSVSHITDTDSSNAKQKAVSTTAQSQRLVQASTDTENDFITGDFNVEGDMNDLNKISQSSASLHPSVQSTDRNNEPTNKDVDVPDKQAVASFKSDHLNPGVDTLIANSSQQHGYTASSIPSVATAQIQFSNPPQKSKSVDSVFEAKSLKLIPKGPQQSISMPATHSPSAVQESVHITGSFDDELLFGGLEDVKALQDSKKLLTEYQKVDTNMLQSQLLPHMPPIQTLDCPVPHKSTSETSDTRQHGSGETSDTRQHGSGKVLSRLVYYPLHKNLQNIDNPSPAFSEDSLDDDKGQASVSDLGVHRSGHQAYNFRRKKSDPQIQTKRSEQGYRLPSPREFLKNYPLSTDENPIKGITGHSAEITQSIVVGTKVETKFVDSELSMPSGNLSSEELQLRLDSDQTSVKVLDDEFVIYGQQTNGTDMRYEITGITDDVAKQMFDKNANNLQTTYSLSRSTWADAIDIVPKYQETEVVKSNSEALLKFKSTKRSDVASSIAESILNQHSGKQWRKDDGHIIHKMKMPVPAPSSFEITDEQHNIPIVEVDNVISNTPVKNDAHSHNSVHFHGTKSKGTGSPFNGKNAALNSAITTEKLGQRETTIGHHGSGFSPIHPQPITNFTVSRSTASTAVSKDLIHPMPTSAQTIKSDSSVPCTMSSNTKETTIKDSEVNTERKIKMIAAHEDQLAAVTSYCKQEMKLLLSAKAGQKNFDEYMRRVSNILSQKISSIQLLQQQISTFKEGGNPPLVSSSQMRRGHHKKR